MTKHTAHGARLRPILFSTAMVQAILEGRKTQTRRVVKPQFRECKHHLFADADWKNAPSQLQVHSDGGTYCTFCGNGTQLGKDYGGLRCPYGQPGDILWVRETFSPPSASQLNTAYLYAADYPLNYFTRGIWKPSIHMPFAAARIFLRIKSVRVERLQDISTEDCISEGLSTTPREHDAVVHLSEQWGQLWQSINGPESWGANPWVWVVEFERVTTEEAKP